MKKQELFLPLTCIVLLAVIMVAGDVIMKQQKQIADNEMWLDFTEAKIVELQATADETQRECIDLLEYSEPTDMSDRVTMAGWDCRIVQEGDLLTPNGYQISRDLSCWKYAEDPMEGMYGQ